MRIAICDDEMNALKQTENIVKAVFDEMRVKYTIEVFTNVNKLLINKAKYDLMFLDIELNNPSGNGVWAAKIIKEDNPECIIIFTTNHEEYIDEVIEKYAFRYWSKPVDKYRLHRSVSAILERMKSITFEQYDTKQIVEVPMRDIIYITPENKRCKVITISDEHTANESFKAMKDKFITRNFCDCHGSFCVNLNFVEKYTKTEVCLKYKTKKYKVHMSRRRYKSFKEQMFIVGGEKV